MGIPLAALVLAILLERARPDLLLRRWWASLPLRRPAVPLRVPAPLALAGLDARRLVLRPSTLGAAYVLYRVLSPPLPHAAYDGVNRLIGFSLAFLGLVLMGVVAATSGRDRGEQLLAALPSGPRSQVLSWVSLLTLLALLEYAALAITRFARDEPAYGALLPNTWELAQGPIMLLGGGLLGLLFARLLPPWVATPVCVVLSLIWVGVMARAGAGTKMLAPLTEWIQYREHDSRVIVEPGSFAWHNLFLLGLCLLGIVAALLREPGRRVALIVGGTAVLTATVVAGALAVP